MPEEHQPDPELTGEITHLLRRWRSGDSAAGEQVIDRLYPELRRLAAHYMSFERSGHTLQPTALVHELYIKLMSGAAIDWKDRAHFFAFAARKLRHILVDHARTVRSGLKAIEETRVALPAQPGWSGGSEADILALDKALMQLEEIDNRSCQALELRFFAGLTDAESAEVLGVSVPTVRRDLTFAKAWLSAQLNPHA
jgi:RNA polymerase sigma factor (TIGR02999 family)